MKQITSPITFANRSISFVSPQEDAAATKGDLDLWKIMLDQEVLSKDRTNGL